MEDPEKQNAWYGIESGGLRLVPVNLACVRPSFHRRALPAAYVVAARQPCAQTAARDGGVGALGICPDRQRHDGHGLSCPRNRRASADRLTEEANPASPQECKRVPRRSRQTIQCQDSSRRLKNTQRRCTFDFSPSTHSSVAVSRRRFFRLRGRDGSVWKSRKSPARRSVKLYSW